MNKKTMMVYGCGGCGVNQITKALDIEDTWTGYALTRSVAIDTSESNLSQELREKPNNAIYLVPGVDGMGKDQALAEDIATGHIEPILKQHPAGDLNLVIFSLSGGTGAVMGRLLLQALIARGLPAIGVVVGNVSNGKESENTFRTLAKLQAFIASSHLPITLALHWNGKDGADGQVDGQIYCAVRRLGLLASGQNQGMDYKDITHWLNYPTVVTRVPPQLNELHIYTSLTEGGAPVKRAISVSSLLVSDESARLDVDSKYENVGYLPKRVVEEMGENVTDLHFLLSGETMSEHITWFSKTYAEQKENLKALEECVPHALNLEDL